MSEQSPVAIVTGASRGAGRGIAHVLGSHVDFADAGASVAAVSIWMGALTTERLTGMMEAMPEHFAHLEGTLETPDYTGHVAWAIYNDPDLMRFNGRTVIGAEAGKDFGITDIAGKLPPSVRETTGAEPAAYFPYKVK